MTEQAQPQTEELKKHGDPLEHVEASAGAHSSKEDDGVSSTEKSSEKE